MRRTGRLTHSNEIIIMINNNNNLLNQQEELCVYVCECDVMFTKRRHITKKPHSTNSEQPQNVHIVHQLLLSNKAVMQTIMGFFFHSFYFTFYHPLFCSTLWIYCVFSSVSCHNFFALYKYIYCVCMCMYNILQLLSFVSSSYNTFF